jgi:DNA adenine methylase
MFAENNYLFMEVSMTVYDMLTEHAITVREISAKYDIPNSTLAENYSRPVDTWSVKVLRATAEQLELPLDEFVEQLTESDKKLSPFIKWVGGKRQLLAELDKYIPNEYGTYYEPFIGGGAVLLHLKPASAVVNDLNWELVNTWQQVAEHPDELRSILRQHKEKNSKEYYLSIREADRNGELLKYSGVERAARFIYLNKTAFNGMWRVNKKGQHNVPYGKYKNPKIDSDAITDVANYLQHSHVQIKCGDYRESLKNAKRGDFVYLDSPYDTVSKTASFTSYTSEGFGKDDQEALRDVYAELTRKGVMVLESNADTEYINELYSEVPGAVLHKVMAKRAINSKGDKRGPVGEVIISNFD